MLNQKTVLVTGGTGSFGQKFVQSILDRFPGIHKVIVFSRDELKQYEMAQKFPREKYPQIRFFLGDVRDRDRLKLAFEEVDYVIHAAALKQVPAAEYNPMECIKTNILGAENVIFAAMQNNVQRVIALSTDKAAAPINLYGATKLCSDKLFVASNNLVGKRKLRMSVVRYGNVIGSRGSVVPFFLQKKNGGILPVTHPEMTRFNISLVDGVELVLLALEKSWGGEIFVPKIPSYRILDVAKAIAPNAKTEIVGIRPGEKLHEEMITEMDSYCTVDCGSYYVILPAESSIWETDAFIKHFKATKVPIGFHYSSGTNENFLTVDEIRNQIRLHVQPEFKVDA
jgi:UDP-N-acetylglucosamine 4,6-dehydratase (inverting)